MRYFNSYDFFNMTSKDLTNGVLISNFKTYQQTTECTCGPSCVKMILNHYDNYDYDELQIAQQMGTQSFPYGTNLRSMLKFLNTLKNKYQIISSLDFEKDSQGNIFSDYKQFKDFVLQNLKNNVPILVENVDYGGHYKIIIGLDQPSVNEDEDVLIFADPYDRNDGNIDGYNYFPADRFFYMWFDDHCLEDDCKKQPFIIIKELR